MFQHGLDAGCFAFRDYTHVMLTAGYPKKDDESRRMTFELKCGENSVRLANKEFQLLEYLMNNPERILSRDMIYDRVWGMESDALSNNLEAYMSFVRKKLKLIGSKASIKTVRNMGYKLVKEE